MEFKTILAIIDRMFLKSFGVEKTNEFLVDFMSQSVYIGDITKTKANECLEMYGCKLPETCWGCLENQPNQLAHNGPGGCLYEE